MLVRANNTGELVALLTLMNVLNYFKVQKVDITKVHYIPTTSGTTSSACPPRFSNRLCLKRSEKTYLLLYPAPNPASVPLLGFAMELHRPWEWHFRYVVRIFVVLSFVASPFISPSPSSHRPFLSPPPSPPSPRRPVASLCHVAPSMLRLLRRIACLSGAVVSLPLLRCIARLWSGAFVGVTRPCA